MAEISPARIPAGTAAGTAPASGVVAPTLPRGTRCQMRKATSANTAMPGTIHGSTLLALGAVVTPTVAPQSLQNRAPGVSAWPHATQFAPASAAPQLVQKRPLAGALQRGQGVGDSDGLMTGKVSDTGHSTGWRRAGDLLPVQPRADISRSSGARAAPDPRARGMRGWPIAIAARRPDRRDEEGHPEAGGSAW